MAKNRPKKRTCQSPIICPHHHKAYHEHSTQRHHHHRGRAGRSCVCTAF
ncbi:hypothetical protein [Moraxella lacunata]